MKNAKTTARIVGVLIISAYGVLISEVVKSNYAVLVADIVSGLSVIGIAILLVPYFKTFSKNLTSAYLFLKILEGTLMIMGGVLYPISSLQHVRGAIYEGVHLYTFIAGGFIFYYLIFRSRIVPRFIAVWGFIAISSLLLTTSLKILGISYPPALDGLLILIISNEIFLAFWLIFKGFRAPQSA